MLLRDETSPSLKVDPGGTALYLPHQALLQKLCNLGWASQVALVVKESSANEEDTAHAG